MFGFSSPEAARMSVREGTRNIANARCAVKHEVITTSREKLHIPPHARENDSVLARSVLQLEKQGYYVDESLDSEKSALPAAVRSTAKGRCIRALSLALLLNMLELNCRSCRLG